MLSKSLRNLIIFFLLEAAIFGLFYSFLAFSSPPIFYIYTGILPVIFAYLIYTNGNLKKRLKELFLSKDVFILVIALTAWVYVYAFLHLGVLYVFETLYVPVFLEEFNFRFIFVRALDSHIGLPRAIIVQSFAYAAFYACYLVFEPGSYPGLYALFYVADMVAIGIIYGVIYLLRKNIYIDMAIHLSLWTMIAVIPNALVWIPYTMAPA